MAFIQNPTFDDYDGILAYLGNDNLRWNAQMDLGTNVIITYSFPQGDDLPEGGGPYGVTDFAGYSNAQQDGFRSVLALVEDFSGIRFVEVESDAMIDGMIGLNGEGVSGYAYYPNQFNGVSTDSDIVMVYTDFEEPGSFSYMIAMHELGHALGLEHTHTGDHVLHEDDDILENSVMTYNITYPIPENFGTFDVAALQHLYGTNADSSQWDVTAVTTDKIKTIASDGDDVFMTTNLVNVVFAQDGNDTVLGRENKDKISGEAGDDVLIGAKGDDWLNGGSGNDVIIGGLGLDILTGGAGADIFVFSQDDTSDRDNIRDFKRGGDQIDLSALDLTFDDLTFKVSADGDHLVILSDEIKILLRDSADLDLTASDFIFQTDDIFT